DAELRRAAGVAGAAEKADLLDDGTVRAVGDVGALRHLVVRADMDHHRHVDVVEMALGDEFGLAQEELDLALFLAAQALLDIDELLGRDGEEYELAGEMLGRADGGEAHRDAEHAG